MADLSSRRRCNLCQLRSPRVGWRPWPARGPAASPMGARHALGAADRGGRLMDTSPQASRGGSGCRIQMRQTNVFLAPPLRKKKAHPLRCFHPLGLTSICYSPMGEEKKRNHLHRLCLAFNLLQIHTGPKSAEQSRRRVGMTASANVPIVQLKVI